MQKVGGGAPEGIAGAVNPSDEARPGAFLHAAGSLSVKRVIGCGSVAGGGDGEVFRLAASGRAAGVPERLRPGSSAASCSTVSDASGSAAVLFLARWRVYRSGSALDDCA